MKSVTFIKDYDLRVHGECGSGGCRTWKSFRADRTYPLPIEQAETVVAAGVATYAD